MSSIKSHDVTDIIDRLKSAYGIRTDAALASFLGIKPNTISMWKKRSFLDFNLIFTKCDDISASWLLTGEGSKDNLDLGQGCPREFKTEDGFGDAVTGESKAGYSKYSDLQNMIDKLTFSYDRISDEERDRLYGMISRLYDKAATESSGRAQQAGEHSEGRFPGTEEEEKKGQQKSA